MNFNDVILKTVSKVIVFIILTFSVYLFFAGHHNPGGGFIGGLVTSSAIVLLYISFDIKSVAQILPFDFKKMAALGVFIAIVSGLGALLFDQPFLNQEFRYFDLPILGETELATALLFDIGVYLTVIGTAITIILSIGEDS